MSEPLNGPRWQREIERRLDNIDRKLEAYNIGVLDNRILHLEKTTSEVKESVRSQGRAMWGLVIAIFTATVSFAAALALGAL